MLKPAMAKKKRIVAAKQQPLLIETTETEAGLEWLRSMIESEIRDKILVELLRRMQTEGDVEAFENIHGRNDKGVDFIVSYNSSVFGRTIKGIQVKSKRITRSEGYGSLSAVRIRVECEAAMMHEFHFDGRKIRLDGIELWCSAPLTDDAEQELNPAHSLQRVGLKKDRDLLNLLEKYCPALLASVPQFGDGAWIAETNGVLGAVTWPQNGEFANETKFITSPDALDSIQFQRCGEPLTAAAGFTDGIQALALNFSAKNVHAPFFESMFAALKDCEDETSLLSPLISFLASERVNERTDDDKTLVLARRVVVGPIGNDLA